MSYATDDFSESLSLVDLDRAAIKAVSAAWGKGDGMGEDAGHYRWSAYGATDWSGGFLMRLIDGRYVYLTGWCDYTGWGCQDGAALHYFDERPTVDEMRASSDSHNEPSEDDWDIDPADLNRWLKSTPESTPSDVRER